MDEGCPRLLVILLGHPHLLERTQGRQDRAACEDVEYTTSGASEQQLQQPIRIRPPIGELKDTQGAKSLHQTQAA